MKLLARSDASAWRAEEQAHALAAKAGGDSARIKVTTEPADLVDCDLAVEAIVEETDSKVALLAELGVSCPDADLATTTSSLGVADLGVRCGYPERTFGLHPFNPVTRMELVELCVPDGADKAIAKRAKSWCQAFGKTVVEVPDVPGFVVNRLLFPYLFDAVRLQERTGLDAADVDRCMTLGANLPMGPLALLDLVGLDVAQAIGNALHADGGDERDSPPKSVTEMVKNGQLGRKSGSGFHPYEKR